MKDLVQCAVGRDDFQRWLDLGHAPCTVWQGEMAAATLIRLEKSPSVDYLYQIAMERDNGISWNDSLTFCGVYDMQKGALYLSVDILPTLTEGKYPITTVVGSPITTELCGKINQRVEDIISNDRKNLPVQTITGYMAQRDLKYYQEYGAKEEAVRCLFDDRVPDGQFHSGYTLDTLPEAAFLAYIQDPEGFVQTEAEMYIKTNQEKFLLQLLENDALLLEYQALMQDAGNPIHRMKGITEAVKTSGAKTVTVTVQKDGQELAFKTAASSLTGHRNCYNTSDIPASDRREFERLFGRYSDYKAEDITRITYGRNTIYKAPAVQSEEMGEEPGLTMEFGGM